jgi:EAL domain-containing protein (putative c-di-GMP-specific phosphodiesterase class I)
MLAGASKNSQALPSHEELFLDYAERLNKHRRGRRAVHLRLSGLQKLNRREAHLRVAVKSFDDLVQRFEGQCYLMSNSDIVVVTKGATVAQIDNVVLKLRYLFCEDPFVESEHNDADYLHFCDWYDLEEEYDALRKLAADMHAAAAGEDVDFEIEDADRIMPQIDRAGLSPMDPGRLERLTAALGSADISSWIRRQPVCAILPDSVPQQVFNELYVSIDELQSRMIPGTDVLSSRWLFQHLTETLDLRVLKHVPDLEREIKSSTSLNLNMVTVLKPEFQDFTRALRNVTNKSMVIEFQSVDVFSNISEFKLARDVARENGFKVCLDGLDDITFPLMTQDELDFDLQKIIYVHELMADTSTRKFKLLRSAVLRADPAKVILCRCDDLEAIKFGRRMGISLFQGRYVDHMVKTRQVFLD